MEPKNIFELINVNVVDMSKDLVVIHDQIQEMRQQINAIYRALYPQELPNADGEVLEDSQVVSETD
jgi:hypothetical protein